VPDDTHHIIRPSQRGCGRYFSATRDSSIFFPRGDTRSRSLREAPGGTRRPRRAPRTLRRRCSIDGEALADPHRAAPERRDMSPAELACHASADRGARKRGLVDDCRAHRAVRSEGHSHVTGARGPVGTLATRHVDGTERSSGSTPIEGGRRRVGGRRWRSAASSSRGLESVVEAGVRRCGRCRRHRRRSRRGGCGRCRCSGPAGGGARSVV
jgi:hypothetical protein